MSKTTVLYPVLHYPPVIGGLEQWEQNIARQQPKDIKVIVVTGRVKGALNYEEKENVLIFRSSPFELRDLSHSPWHYIIFAIPFIFFRSLQLSRKYRVNFFHCHGFASAFIGCLLSFCSGKKFIGTEQSIGWGSGLQKFFRSRVYKRAALCIASSSAVAEEFQRLGVSEYKIKVIPNGVDFNVFRGVKKLPQDREEFEREKEYKILAVGRLEKVKGFKYLIEAFKDIKKEIPHARLEIIGDGSERKMLELQAKNLGISSAVYFVGAVAHDALFEYFRRANIFVMPSLSEGFGITAIEAMASGIPIVATRVGGLLDIVEDGKDAILVESGSKAHLTEAIIFIHDNPEKAKLFVESGLQKAKRYSWDSIALEVAYLYRSNI